MGNSVVLPTMLPVKEAAARFGLSPYFLRNLCHTGQVRYIAVSRNKWLVNADPCRRGLPYFGSNAQRTPSHCRKGIKRRTVSPLHNRKARRILQTRSGREGQTGNQPIQSKGAFPLALYR